MSTVPATSTSPQPYPATLTIDYPDRKLNRLTSFFRIFVAIPILIILVLMSGGTSWDNRDKAAITSTNVGAAAVMNRGGWWHAGDKNTGNNAGTGIVLVLPTVLMILFRQKYPRWWFDWNLAFNRFSTRVGAYILLMRDEYPSTDEEQAVHLDLVYPNVKTELGRGWPLIKWFLAIPHYIILAFLIIAAVVATIIAWFAILFTARYPRGLFEFNEGLMRWALRVGAYAFLLITDKYPPFSLQA